MISFPSLTKSDKIAYTYDSGYVERYQDSLHQYLFQYDTYGDGMTQHSPKYPVSPSNYIDCLASLSDFLIKNPDKDISLYYSRLTIEDVSFLSFLRYKEDKYLYYNLGDKKISSADSKRFDKRWNPIESWMDGSWSAIYRACINQFNFRLNVLEYLHILYLIKQSCNIGYWTDYTIEKFGIKFYNFNDDIEELLRHSENLFRVEEAINLFDCAKRGISNYVRKAEEKS